MAIGPGSWFQAFYHNGYVDMSSFFQNPSRAKKGMKKQSIFTKFNSPYGWASQKIPCNDFVTYHQYLADDKNTSDNGHYIYKTIKNGIEFFHRHHPFLIKMGQTARPH